METPNTVKDLSRAIARLDHYGCAIDPSDVVDINGTNWTGLDLLTSVSDSLAFTTAKNVRLSKITTRSVSLMLAAHGASPFLIDQHARTLARMIRADISSHRMSGQL